MNKKCVTCHYARMRKDICGIYCTGGFVDLNGECEYYRNYKAPKNQKPCVRALRTVDKMI